jgi:succinoglycan biosynthesis transport protein ExoP
MTHAASSNSVVHAPADSGRLVEFSDLVFALWQGKWLIIITTFLTIMAGGYYAYVMVRPVYSSSAVVILEPRVDQIAAFQSVAGSITGDTPKANSEIQILRARSLMQKVVQTLDLTNDPEFNRTLTPPTKKVVLKSKIKRQLGWSQPVERLTDEHFEQRIKDTVVTELLKKIRVDNLRQSTVFRVTASSKSAAKAALIADTVVQLYVQNQIEQKIEKSEQATAWLQTRVQQLQSDLQTAEKRATDFSAATAFVSADNLQALKRQLKDTRERIKIVHQSRKDISSNGTSEDLARTDQQLVTLRISETELAAQIATQDQDQISLQQLGREAQATRDLYEYFLTRLKESAAQQGIQRADSRILSPAVIAYKPSTTPKSLILTMSAIAGLSISLIYILIQELRRQTFRSAAALQRYFNHTILGQFPSLPVPDQPEFLDHLNRSPINGFSSAIRNLRTTLMFEGDYGLPNIIALTSANYDEATAAIAIALARDQVSIGKKVLVIDTDVHEGAFEDFFGDEPTRGIFSILRGEHEFDQCIHHPQTLGADVLFANDRSLGAADLFVSDLFKDFIESIKSRYDLVIFHAPAVSAAPSARVVLKYADVVLFNVKWDKTTKPNLIAALRLLAQAKIQISGFVLTNILALTWSRNRGQSASH